MANSTLAPISRFSTANTTVVAEDSPWRPIHYLGSKLRALGAIDAALSKLVPNDAPVCDLFAGSGTVASFLSATRPVTAIDIQEYSRVICDALLKPVPIPLSIVKAELSQKLLDASKNGVMFAAQPLVELERVALKRASEGDNDLLASIVEAGSLMTFRRKEVPRQVLEAIDETSARLKLHPGSEKLDSMSLRHFGGVYFSFQQAAELDVILSYAHSARRDLRSMFVAATLSTASELVNTVGKHFAQPLRPRDKQGKIKSSFHTQVARDRNKPVLETFLSMLENYQSAAPGAYEHKALRSDYSDFLASDQFDAEVVYADPPYTRDHYSRFYHVLETLALRDDPEITTNTAHGLTRPSRGIYRENRHQSLFCIRSKAPLAFQDLFSKVADRGVPLVLSYSPYASEKNAHPRVMTIDAVAEIARANFAHVELSSVGNFFHSRLNRAGLNKEISYEAEYLIICKP